MSLDPSKVRPEFLEALMKEQEELQRKLFLKKRTGYRDPRTGSKWSTTVKSKSSKLVTFRASKHSSVRKQS